MNPKIAAGLAQRKNQGTQDYMGEDEWLNSSATITRVGKELYETAITHQQREAEARLNQQLQELAAAQALRDEAANHPLSQF